MTTIAFTGPECSGKTTLAKLCAERLGGLFVREYSREYLNDLSEKYTQGDLDKIAQGQADLIKQARSTSNELIFADTEMIVMKIWSVEKYGEVSSTIKKLLDTQKLDLIVLCKPDIPYEEDPLRENPTDRERLFECYLSELHEQNTSFIIVKGTLDERLERVEEEISKI